MESNVPQANKPTGPRRFNKILVNVFSRSLLIHSSLNFWRMQNLGFAYSLIPLVRKLGQNRHQVTNMLIRHLQFFNTHPYMSGPLIGSVLRLEEDLYEDGDCADADKLKKILMGPYAAMGDSFFWGSLKPFSAIVGVALAIKGFLVAPLILLLIYNPIHIWVRLKGFIDGYSQGKDGVNSIRMMNLPRMSRRIRWVSVILLGVLAYIISADYSYPCVYHEILTKLSILIIILFCFSVIKKGISPLYILYGMTILFFVISS